MLDETRVGQCWWGRRSWQNFWIFLQSPWERGTSHRCAAEQNRCFYKKGSITALGILWASTFSELRFRKTCNKTLCNKKGYWTSTSPLTVENSFFCHGYVSGKAQRGENTPVFRQQLVLGYNRETRQLRWDACKSKGIIQFSGPGIFFIRVVQRACPSLGSTVSETPWYVFWASEGEKPSLVRSWKNTREMLPDMLCLSSARAVSVILTSSFSPVSTLDPGMVTEASHLSCLPLYQASE